MSWSWESQAAHLGACQRPRSGNTRHMRTGLDRLEESVLPLVSKPQRYLGEPGGSGPQDFDQSLARVCLLYPGPWEEAVSDPGFLSFRAALGEEASKSPPPSTVFSDWCFSPAPDFEAQICARGLSLFGVESRAPLSRFDLIIAYSKHVLDLPEILALLDLGGCGDANPGESPPLLIAGPSALTPSSFMKFVDGVLMGDPEAFVPDLTRIMQQKQVKHWDRRTCLFYLGEIDGVQVSTAVFGDHGDGQVPGTSPRWLGYFPLNTHRPGVPLLETRAGGMVVELVRAQGVQSPGSEPGPMVSAPLERIVTSLEAAIAASGVGKIVFGGLDASRYPDLIRLVEALNQRLSPHGVTVEFEEVDPAVFKPSLARELRKGRRSGLRFSAVALSARLRDQIGRPLSTEALVTMLETASRGGWSSIRLRALIGLPGETETDRSEWLSMIETFRKNRTGNAQKPHLVLELVPFVPRPHTRGEGTPGVDPAEFQAVVSSWTDHLRKFKVKVQTRCPWMAQAEAGLLHGSSAMEDLMVKAIQSGARRQSDPQHFVSMLWPMTPETWANASPGKRQTLSPITRSSNGTDPDPGAEPRNGMLPLEGFGIPPWNGGRRPRRSAKSRDSLHSDRYRLRFSKTDPLRFVSHLDITRAFSRAFRSSQVPVAVSNGKNRRQKVSFGPPLPLGMTSGAEFLDLVLAREVPESFVRFLNQSLPEGLAVIACAPIRTETASLNSAIQIAEYEISLSDTLIHEFLDGMDFDLLKTRLEDGIAGALASEEINVTKVKGEVSRTFNARPSLLGAKVVRDDGGRPALSLKLSLHRPDSVRPELLTATLLDWADFDERLLRVHRSGLYIPGRKKDLNPLDVIASGFQWWQQPVRGGTVS